MTNENILLDKMEKMANDLSFAIKVINQQKKINKTNYLTFVEEIEKLKNDNKKLSIENKRLRKDFNVTRNSYKNFLKWYNGDENETKG